MFTGKDTISFYSRENAVIWMLMAFQVGLLNIGGLMACHTFVSHTTGFATLVGLKLVEPDSTILQVLSILSIPLFFLIGSAISGYFVDLRIHTERAPQHYKVFGLIFIIILAVLIGGSLGMFGVFGEPLHLTRDYVLIGLLCLACGMQNGAVTSVSKSVIRTTHLTGITTDLGLGIIRVLNKKKYPTRWPGEHKANSMRMGLIVFFVLGSSVGGFAFLHYEYFGFVAPLLTSAYLFFLALKIQLFQHKVRS